MTFMAHISAESPLLELGSAVADDRMDVTAAEGLSADIEARQAQDEQRARTEALERMALEHARCDDAASACWYLCRSMGLARQQEPGEPNLELLFDLLGALADLPAEVCAAPQADVVGEADGLGIFELCNQLAAARDLTQDAWNDAEAANQHLVACPSVAANQLH